jgi:Myb-like DNA-binding domain
MAVRPSLEVSSLEKALKSNKALQLTIYEDLERLACRKAENRSTAARLTLQLTQHWKETSVGVAQQPPGNPYRRWNRLFFVGPDGSTPEPNTDTHRRRKLEGSTFFYHLQPPWSTEETKALTAIVKELQQQRTGSENIDFEEVSRLMHQKWIGKASTHKYHLRAASSPRTADECKIHHQSLTKKKSSPFSKEESLSILEQVHLQAGNPDWESIADSLPTERSAWECLVAYQTKLKPAQPQPWTPAQDELLFKYIAASGPQLVVDGAQVMHLASRLFPSKSRTQISTRINQSLLNPNLRHDRWTDEEERKLAICMKVYKNSSRDLSLASTHLPNRATKSVADKWHRSLNPEYSSRPFSKNDDDALMDALRKEGCLGWTELSRKYFPDRHPQRLHSRWSEIATDDDILARSGDALVRERTKRSGRSSFEGDGVFNADDFIVQVKKKPKL